MLAGRIAAEDPQGAQSQLAALGAKLVIQRAVEEEFDAFLGLGPRDRDQVQRRLEPLNVRGSQLEIGRRDPRNQIVVLEKLVSDALIRF